MYQNTKRRESQKFFEIPNLLSCKQGNSRAVIREYGENLWTRFTEKISKQPPLFKVL